MGGPIMGRVVLRPVPIKSPRDQRGEHEDPHHVAGGSLSVSHSSTDGNCHPRRRRMGPHYYSAEQCEVDHTTGLLHFY